MDVITSRQNPRIKQLVKLRLRRERERCGVILIEGHREISRALQAGVRLKELYVCPGIARQSIPELEGNAEMIEVSPECFEKISTRDKPDGFLAVAEKPDTAVQALGLNDNTLILLVEGVEKPGNLGAIIRSADATGATVIALGPETDFYHANVIRNSQGAVFSVNCTALQPGEFFELLSSHKITLIASCPDTERLLWECDLTGPVAIAVGSEADGLTDDVVAKADQRVRIPMLGQADSLNVSVSAALCLYEAVRQRRQSQAPMAHRLHRH